jgi:choline dehydrogenase-like flavoprotein
LLVIDARPDGLRPGNVELPGTYHHVVGTCAMGPTTERAAVVDTGGRVHGTEGLFVADASVMPDVPSANTHLPTVMVAERIADEVANAIR